MGADNTSVATARSNYPDLEQYFVCAGLDRTPVEVKKWLDNEARWLNQYPNLKVIWVGRAELTGLLTKDEWSYLAVYWLGAPDF